MQPAKSLTSVPSRILALTDGTRVIDVAKACRHAALGFAWNGRHWKKRELARWLVGPYARAVVTRRASLSGEHQSQNANARPNASASPESGVQRVASGMWPISADAIAHVLEGAHAMLLENLRRTWAWRNDASFARDMIDLGLVTGIVDDDSCIGYAPVDAPRMLLVDRVRSLFLADYLTRPRDYESFGVCPRCGSATFDFYVSHSAECMREAADEPQSRLKRRDTSPFTLTSPPPPAVTQTPTQTETLVMVDRPDLVPTIEVVGEIEIDIEIDVAMDEADDEDFDDFGDLRDTLIDPIEAADIWKHTDRDQKAPPRRSGVFNQ